ncbi:MAG TPA: Uma2 family endonuclease [Acidimicrobiales bacterium]|nr:Uma2 family endonuclease [Acidimicrobiales bacterium]
MTLTTTALDGTFTLADWEAMPDDGRRYELIGGTITVSPPPVPGHQRSSRRLERLLEDAAPPDHEVFNAPIGLRLPGDQMVEPDLVVAPQASVGPRYLTVPVLLVVEIVSPGSRHHDRVTKRAAYAGAGIEHYWLVDGTARHPRFTALRLTGGTYHTALDTPGRVDLHDPLTVAFDTTDLFRPPG